jgi:hypothetical protein
MNNSVLEQYKIRFEIIIRDGRKKLNITSKVIPFFSGYFIQVYPEFLVNEIIPDQIDKAAQDGIIHKFRMILNGNIKFLDGLKNAAKRNDGTQIFFPLNKDGVSEVGYQ